MAESRAIRLGSEITCHAWTSFFLQMKAKLAEEGIEYTDPLWGGHEDSCDASSTCFRKDMNFKKVQCCKLHLTFVCNEVYAGKILWRDRHQKLVNRVPEDSIHEAVRTEAALKEVQSVLFIELYTLTENTHSSGTMMRV